MFLDRSQAGRRLAERLASLRLVNPRVIVISTGGVRIGWEIASRLRAPMDVLIPQVVTVPGGLQIPRGVVTDGRFFPNGTALLEHHVPRDYAERMAALEGQVAGARERAYRREAPGLDVAGMTAIVVDDGSRGALAAYSTIEAIHRHGAEEVIYAAPFCTPGVSTRIGHDAKLVTLYPPDEWRSVFITDESFQQTTDDEIISLIAQSRRFPETPAWADREARAGLLQPVATPDGKALATCGG